MSKKPAGLTMIQVKDVLLKVIRETRWNRISVIVYIPVPDGYTAEEVKVRTSPSPKRIPKNARKKMMEVYTDNSKNLSEKRSELRLLYNTHVHPIKRAANIEFKVIKKLGAQGNAQYHKYVFPIDTKGVSIKIGANDLVTASDPLVQSILIAYSWK